MLCLVAQFLLFGFTLVTKVWCTGRNNDKTYQLMHLATYVISITVHDHIKRLLSEQKKLYF